MEQIKGGLTLNLYLAIKNNDKLFQFLKFGVVGVIATGIHYGTYLILEYGFSVNYNFSYTIGYLISFIFNFYASNLFTFKTLPNISNGIKFLGAHCFNYLIHVVLLNVLVGFDLPLNIAPLLVFPVAVIINFLIVRKVLK